MNVTRPTHAPSAALAGPIDRDNSFAAQRRHRRAASALSALAAIAVVLVSAPLAAIVFPLLFAIVALLSLLVCGDLAAKSAGARLRTLLPLLRGGTLAEVRNGALAVELLLGPPPSIPDTPARARVRTALVFPFLMASAMFSLVTFLADHLFLSPALALLMRRRRYLADATAVQLTSDPDSLARGLNLTVNRAAADGWPLARFSPIFLVAPTGFTSGERPIGQSFSTHPAIATRHRRVVRMSFLPGSSSLSSQEPFLRTSEPRRWLGLALASLALTLAVLLVPLMLYLMILVTLLALGVGTVWVLIVLLPLRWLLT